MISGSIRIVHKTFLAWLCKPSHRDVNLERNIEHSIQNKVYFGFHIIHVHLHTQSWLSYHTTTTTYHLIIKSQEFASKIAYIPAKKYQHTHNTWASISILCVNMPHRIHHPAKNVLPELLYHAVGLAADRQVISFCTHLICLFFWFAMQWLFGICSANCSMLFIVVDHVRMRKHSISMHIGIDRIILRNSRLFPRIVVMVSDRCQQINKCTQIWDLIGWFTRNVNNRRDSNNWTCATK